MPASFALSVAAAIATLIATGPAARSASMSTDAALSLRACGSGLRIQIAGLDHLEVARHARYAMRIRPAQIRPHQHLRDDRGVRRRHVLRSEYPGDEAPQRVGAYHYGSLSGARHRVTVTRHVSRR
jgi:hypothetical protein